MDDGTFGGLLRGYRIAAGMTQEALAERAHLSVRALSDLERGARRKPRKDTLALLAEALHLSSEECWRLEGHVQRARRSAALASQPRGAQHSQLWPHPLTPLIGREREEVALLRLLQQPRTRLLTLTGPAGVGKTRLSIQVAAAMQEQFPDGVMFIDLAALRDAHLVLPTIAQVLGVQEHGATPLPGMLVAALGDRQTLLVLDNMEQVLPAATQISALLEQCPQIKALVTSRAALRVRGEHLFLLPPLEYPDPDHLPDLNDVVSYPAIALFCQRAQASMSDFAIRAPAEAQTIARICQRLDGLPLAIELAAARTNLLAPQDLLERLVSAPGTSPFQVLSGAMQDLPDRQQSVRNAIEWSYDLLHAEEQRIFRAFCLFESGATLAALQQVCVCDAGRLLTVLGSLIDNNLILRDTRSTTGPRFTCLELLRAYGLEQLQALGEAEHLQARFAACFLALAEEAEQGSASAAQATWLRRLDADLPHFRAVLQWSLVMKQAEVGLRIVTALQGYWITRGLLSEGRRWITDLLAQTADESALRPMRARALLCESNLALRQGAFVEAKHLSEQSLALFGALEDHQSIAACLSSLGSIAIEQGIYPEAEAHLHQSLALFQESGDTHGTAGALRLLGAAAMYQDKRPESFAYAEQAMALERQHGASENIARCLNNLAGAYKEAGDFRRARGLYEEERELFQEIGSRWGVALATSNLGYLMYDLRDFARAAEYHRASLKARRELGDIDGIAFSLCNLGLAEQDLGHAQEATRLFLPVVC